MAELIVMPKLGLTMTEGTISNWRKAEGDTVAQGDILFDVETDKISNEVEAKLGGVLRKIIVEEGTVDIFQPVAVIGDANEDISALLGGGVMPVAEQVGTPADAGAAAATAGEASVHAASGRIKASPYAKKTAAGLSVDLQQVKGTGPQGRITEGDVRKYAIEGGSGAAPKVKISPAAAKEAAALGIDPSGLHKEGRIMKEDIRSIAAASSQTAVQAAVQEVKRVPMNSMRKIIAKRMLESQAVSPAVTYNMKLDTTALGALRQQLKDTLKVTYTDLLVSIVARSLLEFPLLNCSIEGTELVMRNYVNIGVAVGLEEGLVVPVVKNAYQKGLAEISQDVKRLAAGARSNTLTSDDLTGGTFTITNLGMYGMESFSPIINQPEVAILGVNAIVDTPVAINGEIIIRPLMNISLTADHRAVDGAVAAQFMQKIKAYVENPALLLL
ncbi:dihydrolipoamide acetyltransferase component of pyruvate dehydrogenase complex [Paenibacillus albidus]|uniref:Dihydrolipoamide acetyltransferase component of pyruvate dehydrogenase complex n=1 Tax=Paenibacillus albidus TaxID=2041023 RepID=A0A917CY30_9BACL|nr:dihydrolipoamide acetyltransferase family protein [Paenibacillus albidus]GGF99516.1 dihydrolipoamide acetyltransferase component of pyruvate dehydrogenase complex [Paenibacillus albidus]